ncbi:MAG: YihY/virulence factor BrkB family protein [Chloroflexota bacterium]
MKPKVMLDLVKKTFSQWNEDKAPQLAAALSFYALFSMAPLLIVAIAVVGLAFGQQAAQNQIVGQIRGMVGEESAVFIQSMIQNANKPGAGILATVIGVITLLLGAAGAFNQLKMSLNQIWNVEAAPSPGGIKGILKSIQQQFISFTMVLGTGFLLLVSLVLSAVLSALGTFLGERVAVTASLWELVNFVVSVGIITLLFAAIYKVLPDAKIAWRDVWIGALITSLLFTFGKFLIGLYLSKTGAASSYGAAGALVVILLWIYYSSQILFLGAEFTQVYANSHGSHPAPEYKAADTPTPSAADQKPARVVVVKRGVSESLVTISHVFSILAPAVMLIVRIWMITAKLRDMLTGQEEVDRTSAN